MKVTKKVVDNIYDICKRAAPKLKNDPLAKKVIKLLVSSVRDYPRFGDYREYSKQIRFNDGAYVVIEKFDGYTRYDIDTYPMCPGSGKGSIDAALRKETSLSGFITMAHIFASEQVKVD